MNKSDLEKARLGSETLGTFFQEFQTDVYSTIVLEEFFKALYGITEDLSLPSETGQKGSSTIEQLSHHTIVEPEQGDERRIVETPEGNGQSDIPKDI